MFKQIVNGSICIMALSGCATFKSLDMAAHLPLYERILIYSGTRLDWAAIARNDAALSKLKATPPCYPIIDLPLSFALDSIFLPLTASAAIFH
jgi:uncharacterized protein YceK